MFKKVKGFLQSVKGKVACASAAVTATLGSTITAFAADGTTYKDYISQYWDLIKADFTPATVLGIIGVVIGAVILLFLFWFGIRWATRKISVALKKGKISV